MIDIVLYNREPRAESREPRAESREPSCVRRPDGSLRFPHLLHRVADAVSRAGSARRERPSRRLSFRSRRPAGPATPSSPSFVRRLPRAAVGLLLVLAALFVASTAAHAQTTLVSNFNQGNDSNAGFTRGVAQPFTTGLNSGGYTLNSVEFGIETLANQAAFSVSVCGADTNGHPTSTCEDLTFSRSTAAGRYFYDAPAGTALFAGTSYTVVFTTTNGTVTYDVTRSDDEDSGGAAGWTLEDEYRFLNSSLEWVSTSNKALRMTIRGTLGGTTLSTDAALSALVLTDSDDGAVVDLDPAFASTERSYNARVESGVNEITVVPTLNDTNATYVFQGKALVELTDTDDVKAGFQVALERGDNVVRVKVTAEDDDTTRSYKVDVSRALARPLVVPTEGTRRRLDVSWTAPADTTVVGYDVQYRAGDSGRFTDGPQDRTGTSATIQGLTPNTSYQVQVRMTTAKGDSEWSPIERAWTHPLEVAVPSDWDLKPDGAGRRCEVPAAVRVPQHTRAQRQDRQLQRMGAGVRRLGEGPHGHTGLCVGIPGGGVQ